MFARADAQIVERLLDEPVGDLCILAQLSRESLVAAAQASGFLAQQKTRSQARFGFPAADLIRERGYRWLGGISIHNPPVAPSRFGLANHKQRATGHELSVMF
jgi:hypothetical protein